MLGDKLAVCHQLHGRLKPGNLRLKILQGGEVSVSLHWCKRGEGETYHNPWITPLPLACPEQARPAPSLSLKKKDCMAQKLHGEVARPPRLLWKLEPAVHDVGHPLGVERLLVRELALFMHVEVAPKHSAAAVTVEVNDIPAQRAEKSVQLPLCTSARAYEK